MLYVLLLILLAPATVQAQWVDQHGNSVDRYKGLNMPHEGTLGYRKPDGRIDWQPVVPHRDSQATPHRVPHRTEGRDDILTRKVPSQSTQPGSTFLGQPPDWAHGN